MKRVQLDQDQVGAPCGSTNFCVIDRPTDQPTDTASNRGTLVHLNNIPSHHNSRKSYLTIKGQKCCQLNLAYTRRCPLLHLPLDSLPNSERQVMSRAWSCFSKTTIIVQKEQVRPFVLSVDQIYVINTQIKTNRRTQPVIEVLWYI